MPENLHVVFNLVERLKVILGPVCRRSEVTVVIELWENTTEGASHATIELPRGAVFDECPTPTNCYMILVDGCAGKGPSFCSGRLRGLFRVPFAVCSGTIELPCGAVFYECAGQRASVWRRGVRACFDEHFSSDVDADEEIC